MVTFKLSRKVVDIPPQNAYIYMHEHAFNITRGEINYDEGLIHPL